MNIHSFIFHWYNANRPYLYTNTLKYEEILKNMSHKTSVINCSPYINNPLWVNLHSDAYFTEQWIAATTLFDSDILFHCQSDIFFDSFNELFDKARYVFSKYNCGIYQPNIDWTAWSYKDLSKLKKLDTNLYQIPESDSTIWFVHKDIIKECPKIEYSQSKYGWWVDPCLNAICKLQGKITIRDYSFTVKHEQITNYNADLARLELANTIEMFPDSLKLTIKEMIDEFTILNA